MDDIRARLERIEGLTHQTRDTAFRVESAVREHDRGSGEAVTSITDDLRDLIVAITELKNTVGAMLPLLQKEGLTERERWLFKLLGLALLALIVLALGKAGADLVKDVMQHASIRAGGVPWAFALFR